MSNHPPFDDLARRLLARGMPAPAVARYLGELRDHCDDLAAELLAQGNNPQTAENLALARLGTPQSLAHAALSARQRQFFTARHPWLCFAILPALLAPVVTSLIVLTPLICWAWAAHVIGRNTVSLILGRSWWCFLFWGSAFMNYLWPGLMARYVYHAAWRRGLGWNWRLASVTIVLFWGTWLNCVTEGDISHQGRFTMGVHFQITKIFAALLITAAGVWWLQRRTRMAIPPQPTDALHAGS
jgi:hypothetical protein